MTVVFRLATLPCMCMVLSAVVPNVTSVSWQPASVALSRCSVLRRALVKRVPNGPRSVTVVLIRSRVPRLALVPAAVAQLCILQWVSTNVLPVRATVRNLLKCRLSRGTLRICVSTEPTSAQVDLVPVVTVLWVLPLAWQVVCTLPSDVRQVVTMLVRLPSTPMPLVPPKSFSSVARRVVKSLRAARIPRVVALLLPASTHRRCIMCNPARLVPSRATLST